MAQARQIEGAAALAAELARAEPCVVEFWTVGCPACARFEPVFAAVAEELADRATFVALEARKNMELAKQHAIRGVPAVIVFRDGAEVQRTSGAKDAEQLRAWLAPALD